MKAFGTSFRKAGLEDAAPLTALVNLAYRGDASRAGWTTEADIIDGTRIDEPSMRNLIAAEGSLFLLCLRGDTIIGSVHLERTGGAAYLGLFVVRPDLQGAGIGKRIMEEAEALAQREWASARMWMTVITVRPELIAFYERRGYHRTGHTKPFPQDAGASVPRVEGLELEVLEKNLGASD